MDLERFRTITTERLMLRPLDEVDPDALVAALDDFDVSRWLTRVPHPYTRTDADKYLARCVAGAAPLWSIHDDDGLCGGIGFDKHLGFWLTPGVWGRGYTTEAARAVLAAHFADPGAGDVGSSYFVGNDASARVLQKLGFRETGTCKLPSLALGREVDLIELELSRVDYATMPLFTLRTDRLVLDALRADDWPVVQAEWGNPKVARMTASVTPDWSAAKAKEWIRTRSGQSPDGFGLAIRLHNGTLIGSVGMGGTPRNLGYMLGEDHWGKGYATEAVGAVLRAAYRSIPELDELRAGVFDDNPASVAVLKKLGFVAAGPGDCTSLARLEPSANTEYRLTRSSLKA